MGPKSADAGSLPFVKLPLDGPGDPSVSGDERALAGGYARSRRRTGYRRFAGLGGRDQAGRTNSSALAATASPSCGIVNTHDGAAAIAMRTTGTKKLKYVLPSEDVYFWDGQPHHPEERQEPPRSSLICRLADEGRERRPGRRLDRLPGTERPDLRTERRQDRALTAPRPSRRRRARSPTSSGRSTPTACRSARRRRARRR